MYSNPVLNQYALNFPLLDRKVIQFKMYKNDPVSGRVKLSQASQVILALFTLREYVMININDIRRYFSVHDGAQ